MSGTIGSERTGTIVIDVFSDVVCPFCFIGKRQLERALADEPEGSVEVRWHAFLLNPELPPGDVDEHTYFVQKFGGEERARAAHARVTEYGATVGIAFDFRHDPAHPRPVQNTLPAHQAIALAAREGRQDEAVEACFRGYFEQRRDLSDLATVAELTGADRDALEAGEGLQEVKSDLETAQALELRGVPFFLADRSVAVSGAQEPALFRKLLAAARQRRG
jgi:predicted DsbA family dithiol-disulfide isomerase